MTCVLCCRLLLERWNDKSALKSNLLTTAILFGHEAILKYLLQDMSISLASDNNNWGLSVETGWTPLMFAARLGYLRGVKLLLEYFGSQNVSSIRNALGLSIQDVACDNVKQLLCTDTENYHGQKE